MLVLVSFGLLLLATVFLVLGLLIGEDFTFLYLSIASAVVSSLVLCVAWWLSKPKRATPAEPESRRDHDLPATEEHTPVLAASTVVEAPAEPASEEAPPEPDGVVPAATAAGTDDDGSRDGDRREERGQERRDDRRGLDEWLAADRDWQRQAEERRRRRERAPRPTPPAAPRKAARPAAAKAAQRNAAAEREVEGRPAKPMAIETYDDLPASEVVSRLSKLTDGQLRTIREYEAAKARRTVLANIDRRLAHATEKGSAAHRPEPHQPE